MGTKEYWVNELEKFSRNVLLNPSDQNRKDLRDWFKRRISFEDDVSEIECIREIDARPSSVEIMISLCMIGAKEFSGYLWSRQIDNRNKLKRLESDNNRLTFESIDRYVAFNILDRHSFTEIQILKILSYLPNSQKRDFETLIKNSTQAAINDLNNIDSDLVRILIPYFDIHTDARLLLASCKHRKIGNWMERLEIAFEKSPQSFSDENAVISQIQIEAAHFRSALLQIKVLSGEPEALLMFLEKEQYFQYDKLETRRASPEELGSMVTQSFKKGGYSDQAFNLARKKLGQKVPGALIAAAAKSKQGDLDLFKVVTNYLVENRLWKEFIEKMNHIPLSELSESDFKSLVRASKETHNFDLALHLHEYKNIEHNSLLSRCASELLNSGEVQRGIELFRELQKQPPTQGYQPNETVFLNNLNGYGLIEYDLIKKLNKAEYLLRIAEHLSNSLAPLADVNKYLKRAIFLKDPAAASLFVELNAPNSIEREILELASQHSFEPIGSTIARRELAKVLIAEGNRERALSLAAAAAETDDEAAHLMIYVLNENVALWAHKLHERGADFSPGVFKNQFLAQGIPIAPRYSALDNLELHQLVREGAPKQNRSQTSNQSLSEEAWICREALTKYGGAGNWDAHSCQNHRSRMNDFISQKMFKDLGHFSWENLIEKVKSESTILTVENRPNLAKLLARREPRAWQKEAFNAWVAHGRHGIIEAATGSGKSMLGVMAALEAMDEGYAVVIVVPTRVLQQQWIKQYFLTLWDAPGPKIKTIGNADGDYVREAGQISPGSITIAVAKSLRENPALNPREGAKSLIIADEVHNYTSEKSQNMFSDRYTRRLGLTATLEPPRGRYPVLANYFGGDPVYRYDFTRAVMDKVISPYNLVTIGVPLERELARLYTAAYVRMKNAKDQLLSLAGSNDNPEGLNRNIEIFRSKGLHAALINEYESSFEESDNYLKSANSKAGAIRLVTDFIKNRGNTIVFSDLVATARNIQIIFTERGVSSEVISAEVPQSERETIFRKLKNKNISALLSPKALDEGVDIEQLSTGVFAGASRRRLQIVQRLGRVLRISENKQMPLLILIVADGTEEDPCMPNNQNLENSPFGIVHEQAVSAAHFKLDEEDKIRRYLSSLSQT